MMNTPPDANQPDEEIPNGTAVYDASGDKAGHVTLSALRDGYFVVEQGLIFTHELFLPPTAIRVRTPKEITLRLLKEELKDEQWKRPPAESASSVSAQPIVPPNPSESKSPLGEGEVIHLPPAEEEPPLANR
jgi:hypothetical protein